MPYVSKSGLTLGRRLFVRAYEDFGAAAPENPDGWSFGVTVATAGLYVALMALFWLTLNVGTIPFGVFVEPLWRPGAKFRRLTLPNGIPLIAICLPVLLAYAGYNTYRLRGHWLYPLGPFLLVAAAGLLALASIVIFNRIRRRLNHTP